MAVDASFIYLFYFFHYFFYLSELIDFKLKYRIRDILLGWKLSHVVFRTVS